MFLPMARHLDRHSPTEATTRYLPVPVLQAAAVPPTEAEARLLRTPIFLLAFPVPVLQAAAVSLTE